MVAFPAVPVPHHGLALCVADVSLGRMQCEAASLSENVVCVHRQTLYLVYRVVLCTSAMIKSS